MLRLYQLYVAATRPDRRSRRARDRARLRRFALTSTPPITAGRRDIAKRFVTAGAPRAEPGGAGRASTAPVARIRSKFDIPLILKGIATAEMPRIAVGTG